jgi:hypothetical protein
MMFTPLHAWEVFDYMYTEPPLVDSQDVIGILQCANGLRPLSDLEAHTFFDKNSALAELVDGQPSR